MIAKALVAWVDVYPKDSDALYEVGLEFIYKPAEAMNELKSVLERSPLKRINQLFHANNKKLY